MGGDVRRAQGSERQPRALAPLQAQGDHERRGAAEKLARGRRADRGAPVHPRAGCGGRAVLHRAVPGFDPQRGLVPAQGCGTRAALERVAHRVEPTAQGGVRQGFRQVVRGVQRPGQRVRGVEPPPAPVGQGDEHRGARGGQDGVVPRAQVISRVEGWNLRMNL